MQQTLTSSMRGPKDFKNLMFYVPVLFVKESPKRKMLLSPFQADSASSDDPFNVSFRLELAVTFAIQKTIVESLCRKSILDSII